MSDPNLKPEDARQGKTGQGVRYVLIASTLAAIAALALIFGVFAGG